MRLYHTKCVLCWLSLVLICFGTLSTAAQDTTPKIAFISDRDGRDNVFVMEADGSGATNLTNSAMPETGLLWSPDGQTIVFSRQIDNDIAQDIFIVALDGSDPVQLTDGEKLAYSAAWSPDGSQLAIMSGDFSSTHISLMNADGSDRHLLIEGEADTDNTSGSPAWSPDGTQIAFRATQGDDRGNIMLVNPDGSNLQAITDTPDTDIDPRWSADGSKIMYVSDASGNFETYIMNADGSDAIRLTELSASVARWSPDGSQIFFAAFVDDALNIYVVDAAGGDPVLLTDEGTFNLPYAWSADGSQILFTSDRDGNNEIYVMNADGSDLVNLTNNPADDTSPQWQPVVATGS